MSSLSSTSSASRTGPDTRRPGLDLVDDFGLSLVEPFERRPPGFEQDHAPISGAPVGRLLEPKHVAVEGKCTVEVRNGQRDPQLLHDHHDRVQRRGERRASLPLVADAADYLSVWSRQVHQWVPPVLVFSLVGGCERGISRGSPYGY